MLAKQKAPLKNVPAGQGPLSVFEWAQGGPASGNCMMT